MRLVAVSRKSQEYEYGTRQLPVTVDKELTLVLQLDDPLRSGYRNSDTKIDLRTFIKNYNILTGEKVKQACMMSERNLSDLLSDMVPCVGCRRSVEQMFNQLSQQQHGALDPLQVQVAPFKSMSVKRNISTNPTALYKLFYHDVFYMYNQIANLMNIRKNKRCYIHSLEMQKPRVGRSLQSNSSNSNSGPQPMSQLTPIPFISWMDIWNDLSKECKEEVLVLDCGGILDLMDDYLKRHRFCKDCKSKVARAFGILVDEIDPSKESGYCRNVYAGLKFCGPKSEKDFGKPSEGDYISEDSDEDEEEDDDDDDDDEEYYDEVEDIDSNQDYIDCSDNVESSGSEEQSKDKSMPERTSEAVKKNSTDTDTEDGQIRHIHVYYDTNFIARLMARAETEISGGNRPERHAKTVDVAQDEVLTCISLYLYERLHKLWRNVRSETQTWRILFYVSVTNMRRVFETFVEEKGGMGRLEALCEELEEEERKLEERQEKKRQKKKRQKKRKEARKQEVSEVHSCDGTSDQPVNPKTSPRPAPKAGVNRHEESKENRKPSCNRQCPTNGKRSPVNHSHDLGYSSGCCESSVNSREGSDVVSIDDNDDHHVCADVEDKAAMHKEKLTKGSHSGCKSCETAFVPPKPAIPPGASCKDCYNSQDSGRKGKKKSNGHCQFHSRLLEMLGEDQGEEEHDDGAHVSRFTGTGDGDCYFDCCGDDEELTAEEIAEFELNRSRIREERIVLRERFRKDFEQLCGKNENVVHSVSLNGKRDRSGHECDQ